MLVMMIYSTCDIAKYNKNNNISCVSFLKSFFILLCIFSSLIKLIKTQCTSTFESTAINTYTVENTDNIYVLAESKAGHLVSAGSDGYIRIYDTSLGLTLIRSMYVGGTVIYSMMTSSADGYLYVPFYNDYIYRFDSTNSYTYIDSIKTGQTSIRYIGETSKNKIITAGSDFTIKIWDPYTSSLLNTIRSGHTSDISKVIETKGGFLISASYDKSLRIFNGNNNYSNYLKVDNAHNDAINTIVEFSTGIILTGSNDGTIKVWSMTASSTTLTSIKTLVLGTGVYVYGILELSNGNILAGGQRIFKIWNPSNNYGIVKTITTSKAYYLVYALVKMNSGAIFSAYKPYIQLWNNCSNNPYVSNCLSVSNTGCLQCQSGYVLYSGYCFVDTSISTSTSTTSTTSTTTTTAATTTTGTAGTAIIIEGCQTTSSANVCTKCLTGYFLTAANTCSKCSTYCSSCSDATKCDTCITNYTLVSGICFLSSNLNCKRIDAAAMACIECNSGFTLNAANFCVICPNACQTCTSSMVCTSCINTYYTLQNGVCSLTAASTASTTSSVITTTSSQVNANGTSITPNGAITAATNTLVTPTNNLPISPACLKTSGSSCLECAESHYLNAANQCAKCLMTNCSYCGNYGSACFICLDGYTPIYSRDEYGRKNIKDCIRDSLAASSNTISTLTASTNTCLKFDTATNKCLMCSAGFFLNSEGSCSLCSSADRNCEICSGQGVCTKCLKTNYEIQNGKCKCLQNCLPCDSACINCDDGVCMDIKCPQNCLKCSNSNECSICREGFILSEQKLCDFNTVCKNFVVPNVCGECLLGYTLKNGVCLCYGIIDSLSNTCCDYMKNCSSSNIRFFSAINSCGCTKCEKGFQYNYQCYDDPPISNCYIWNEEKKIFLDINEDQCITGIKNLIIVYQQLCLKDLIITDFPSSENKSEKYFIFSMDLKMNYIYLGYRNQQEAIDKLNCDKNIHSYFYAKLNCTAELNDEIFQHLDSAKNLQLSTNDLKIFLDGNDVNFKNDMVDVYVNICNKDFNFKGNQSYRKYCIDSDTSYVDLNNGICKKKDMCKVSNSNYQLDMLTNDKCFDCGSKEFHYDYQKEICYSSLIYDAKLRFNVQIIIFSVAGICFAFEVVLAFLYLFKYKNDILKQNQIKEWGVSIYGLIDICLDLGFLIGSVFTNVIIKYTSIGVLIFQPVALLVYGIFLFLVSKSRISCYNNFFIKIIFCVPFGFIFMVFSMLHFFGNSLDPCKINMFLQDLINYDMDKETNKKKIKLSVKTVDYFLEGIPEIVLKIIVIINSKETSIFSYISVVFSCVGVFFSTYFLITEWNVYLKNQISNESGDLEKNKTGDKNSSFSKGKVQDAKIDINFSKGSQNPKTPRNPEPKKDLEKPDNQTSSNRQLDPHHTPIPIIDNYVDQDKNASAAIQPHDVVNPYINNNVDNVIVKTNSKVKKDKNKDVESNNRSVNMEEQEKLGDEADNNKYLNSSSNQNLNKPDYINSKGTKKNN